MPEDLLHSAAYNTAIEALDTQRKAVVEEKKKSLTILLGAVILFGLGFVIPGLFNISTFLAVAIFITACVFYYKSGQKFDDYRYDFKKNIVTALLRTVDPNLTFDANGGVLEVEFVNSSLFNKVPDRYKSGDEVSGMAGKTYFKFSEVCAEYMTRERTNNGTREVWHDLFTGLLFYADFNKNFKGLTVVRPKEWGSGLFEWITDKLPAFLKDKELVKLENPEFMKKFTTYSNNQIEARYILTPAMMNRLCELNDKNGSTISISFISSKVYIAFPTGKDYFEPPLYQSLANTKSIQEDLNVIRFMYGIIQELDLNTRIWGKD